MTFTELNIIEPILRALNLEGYDNPTPIQEKAIPVLLKGKDLLGTAQTGTGKTAAFSLPIIQQLFNNKTNDGKKPAIKALILAPTRELASQIGDNIKRYSKYLGLKTVVIFGGVSQGSQTRALNAGVDILVATPGRLLDLMQQRFIILNQVDFFVLDEADRMLDMGFVNDVQKIASKIPTTRQTMLFSATLPKSIINLAKEILTNPVELSITPVSQTIDVINQVVYNVRKQQKADLLVELLKDNKIDSALIFSRTKHGANKIVTRLKEENIAAEAIHGNKSQSAREFALRKFKTKDLRVLVATDIASRGIDIEKLSHVINYDLPDVPETYIHRIGRTGRAGEDGAAITFCSPEEASLLKDIEKHIGMKIEIAVTPTLPEYIKKKSPAKTGSKTKTSDSKNNNDRKNESFTDQTTDRKPFSKTTDYKSRDRKDRDGSRNNRTNDFNDNAKSFSNGEYKPTNRRNDDKSYGAKDNKRTYGDKPFKKHDDFKQYGKRNSEDSRTVESRNSFNDSRKTFKKDDNSFGAKDNKCTYGDRPFKKHDDYKQYGKRNNEDSRTVEPKKPFNDSSKTFRNDDYKSRGRNSKDYSYGDKNSSKRTEKSYAKKDNNYGNRKSKSTTDYSSIRTYNNNKNF